MGKSNEILSAFISKDGTYSISCMHCGRSSTHRLADIPPDRPNPFPYDCACGHVWRVRLVGFRKGERKRVKLTARVTRLSDPKKMRTMSIVEDISLSGMRLSSEPMKFSSGEALKVLVLLDQPRKTTLELQAKVRRLIQSKHHFSIALEYEPLSDSQRDTLVRYMEALP